MGWKNHGARRYQPFHRDFPATIRFWGTPSQDSEFCLQFILSVGKPAPVRVGAGRVSGTARRATFSSCLAGRRESNAGYLCCGTFFDTAAECRYRYRYHCSQCHADKGKERRAGPGCVNKSPYRELMLRSNALMPGVRSSSPPSLLPPSPRQCAVHLVCICNVHLHQTSAR